MSLLEIFRIALNALSTNRLRALLTTLGIMIGVASVVSLMSLGGSLQSYIQGQFESLNAEVLNISASRGRFTASGTQPLTTADVEGLQDPTVAPHVVAVAATYTVRGNIGYGATSESASIEGVTVNYGDVNNWRVGSGRFINDNDIANSERIVVLDQTAASDLFATANPVGQTILVANQVFTVVGVMEERATSGFSQTTVLIPITTAQTRLANAHVAGKGYRVSTIQAQAVSTDSADITAATDEVTNFLLKAHRITNASAADFSVNSAASVLDSLSSTLSLVTLFLSAIAGISLLVGGIGVMNIMLVSVTERTREIGLRKAVGAQASTILTQFLFESILLSLLGGAVGITLGGGILLIVGRLIPQFTIALTPELALLATGISSAIGIISGMYPANRAAKMRPIDALRFE